MHLNECPVSPFLHTNVNQFCWNEYPVLAKKLGSIQVSMRVAVAVMRYPALATAQQSFNYFPTTLWSRPSGARRERKSRANLMGGSVISVICEWVDPRWSMGQPIGQ